MRILVTGGSGFIGSNFVRLVLRERADYQLVNLDALTASGNPENLLDIEPQYPERYQFVRGDIRDMELVRELIETVDAVVHMAAESHVDYTAVDARPLIETNVLGTQTLLDAMRAVDPDNRKRFVHVSTDEVFGTLPLDDPSVSFTEDTPLQPNSPYAASKAASDMVARAYHHTFGMDIRITNGSNNFGPYQFPDEIIPLFVTHLIQGEQVPLYGDGRHVRDWLHVEDHCEALLTVLEKGRAGERYNIGGNNERSNLELAHMILDIMGHGEVMVRRLPDWPAHDRRHAVDASKIRRETGWRPTRSDWPDALLRTVRWYVEHTSWWQHVNSGKYRADYQRQDGGS